MLILMLDTRSAKPATSLLLLSRCLPAHRRNSQIANGRHATLTANLPLREFRHWFQHLGRTTLGESFRPLLARATRIDLPIAATARSTSPSLARESKRTHPHLQMKIHPNFFPRPDLRDVH